MELKKVEMPDRIVEEPIAVMTKGSLRRLVYVRCDNGQVYEIGDLAILKGMVRRTLLGNIKKLGFDHPGVLKVKKPGPQKGQKPSAFGGLSDRPRNENL